MNRWTLCGTRSPIRESHEGQATRGNKVTSEPLDETIAATPPSSETLLWRQVVNALPDGVMVVDDGGQALAVNDALERIAERAEVRRDSCCELFGCNVAEGDIEGGLVPPRLLAPGLYHLARLGPG